MSGDSFNYLCEVTTPLFNECPCGAAISIPLAHPECGKLAGEFEDKHRHHRIAVARAALRAGEANK